MELLPIELEQFALNFSTPPDPLRQEVEAYTRQNHAEPHMLSGPVQGKLLEMISHMIRPRRILEVGTFTGYSALCLAEGLTNDGELHTIEFREETAAIAHNFFQKSALYPKIKLHVGNALNIIPTLNESWDLVFIDADKPGYIDYFKLVLPAVRKNGFILADNIFFHGQVFTQVPKGKSAKAIKAFNDFVHHNDDIDKLVLTIRDGLYLLRKL
ncbi:O-methyltransferase [Niabella drilacis]|uniref:Predicted O-methyltransferase YrrM n=1 Tax=Niabella drilacis (strain DSM 25811 / CCM 8410 / CCUG 62505 / LMG 26954 / E90) TaxID=1285928 RepID=A0A1G6T336_NIADE|nr:O-methyltransferase [Niabella drilacis]SDD23274.1 Predicted O-methyltransferase YrrM [Niabella drilacis]